MSVSKGRADPTVPDQYLIDYESNSNNALCADKEQRVHSGEALHNHSHEREPHRRQTTGEATAQSVVLQQALLTSLTVIHYTAQQSHFSTDSLICNFWNYSTILALERS